MSEIAEAITTALHQFLLDQGFPATLIPNIQGGGNGYLGKHMTIRRIWAIEYDRWKIKVECDRGWQCWDTTLLWSDANPIYVGFEEPFERIIQLILEPGRRESRA